MKTNRTYAKTKILVIASALSIALSACNLNTEVQQQDTLLAQNAFASLQQNNNDYYVNLYNNADEQNKYQALVLLTRSTIISGNLDEAAQRIVELRKLAKTELEKDQERIVEALYWIHKKNAKNAKLTISKVQVQNLPKENVLYYYQLDSNIEQALYKETNDISHLFFAFDAKYQILSYLDSGNVSQVYDGIFKVLSEVDNKEIVSKLKNESNEDKTVFFEYAIINNASSDSLKEKLTNDFIAKHENHPLATYAKSKITTESTAASENGSLDVVSNLPELKDGDKVAVLLPLSGRYAKFVGEPARLGVLAALQDRKAKLDVTFYDTNKIDVTDIAADLKKNKIDFIIGPILKEDITKLVDANLGIPVIAFNKTNSTNNLWYFDLGPEYEGVQVARRIKALNYKKPTIIYSTDNKGQRTALGFNNEWDNFSAIKADACTFTNIDNIKTSLPSCALSNADSVYINATAIEAKEIKSFIPKDTPIFMSDSTYQGFNNSAFEITMMGSELGDMPWLLTDSKLKDTFFKNIPKADVQVQKIFACAYDSINLAYNLNKLSVNQNDVLRGLSGDIRLGDNGLIEMKPMWVKLGYQR